MPVNRCESETVWKAIYHHYQPVRIEADAPPSNRDLGASAVTWDRRVFGRQT